MSFHRLVAAVLLSVLAAACSGGTKGGAGASPAPTNAIPFPLFDGAQVLSARAWHQTITAHPGSGENAIFTQGAGTYDGHDTVAGTQALMPALELWLQKLEQQPPDGYTAPIEGNGIEAVRTRTRDLGIDFLVFEGIQNGKHHGVIVLVVDPQLLDSKAGPWLSMVGKYHLLPQSFRDSIDAQTKKETGFTVSDATNPDTPIGAAIGALDQLRDYGGRGVILVDAVKQ